MREYLVEIKRPTTVEDAKRGVFGTHQVVNAVVQAESRKEALKQARKELYGDWQVSQVLDWTAMKAKIAEHHNKTFH
jgi:hypothetical protein